jgi:hypothetical protein
MESAFKEAEAKSETKRQVEIKPFSEKDEIEENQL